MPNFIPNNNFISCFLICFMLYSILVIYVTRVYVVRHCETQGNALGLLQGHSDFDITELGARQLAAVSNRFTDIVLDKVYCGPLIRTVKTGEAIIGQKDLKPIIHNGLIELNFGIWEGKPFTQLPQFVQMWNNCPHNIAPDGGEAITDGYERIWNTVKEIAMENKGKTIALATHGGVTRCLLCRLIEKDVNQLVKVPFVTNTSVSLIEFDDEFNPTLIFYNDDSHITEELKGFDNKALSGDK